MSNASNPIPAHNGKVDAAHPPGWLFNGNRFHFFMRGFSLCRRFTYVRGKILAEDGQRVPQECPQCLRAAKSHNLLK